MALLSVFSEENMLFHLPLAAFFFLMSFLAFLLIGSRLLRSAPRLGWFSIMMGLFALPIPLISGFAPIFEHIAVAGIILWALVMWFAFGRSDEEERYSWLWGDSLDY